MRTVISPRSKKRSCGVTTLSLEIARVVDDLQELASEGEGKKKMAGKNQSTPSLCRPLVDTVDARFAVLSQKRTKATSLPRLINFPDPTLSN